MTPIQAQNSGTLLNLMKQLRNPSTNRIFIVLLATLIVTFASSNSYAVVKFFDGFGDADLNNNGTPLEAYDVDAGDSAFDDPNGANSDLFYTPSRLNTPDPNDVEPSNPEITSVLDAGDTGLPWFQMRGFTGSNEGRAKPTARIVDDTTGAMLDTTAVGPPGALGNKAINTGYGLSYNSRGRGSSIAAFFGENVALGPEQGDSIKVSFDFRVWRDAPALNAVVQPEDAELRFGLYQDTDNQLGTVNGLAGRSVDLNGDFFLDPVPAVWGEEEGRFEGGQVGGFGGTIPTDAVGAIGDVGWFGAVILEDPAGQFPPIVPNGGGWRIREESNDPITVGPRILQGSDTDTVASPQDANPPNQEFGLTNLNVNNVWHLSLELVRDMDPNGAAAITANLSAFDVDDPNTVFTLSGTELTNDPNGNVTMSVDNFDYFAIRNTGFDDYDMILDNFTLELEGSNAAVDDADFDGSGFVDGKDFLIWQANHLIGSQTDNSNGDANGDGTVNNLDLAIWETQYGSPPPLSAAVAAVPEPGSLLLFLLGLVGMRLELCGARSHRTQ